MEKFCVFCGEKPDKKSVEHVIPEWLIKLTGDPKRKANFGYHHISGEKLKLRTFSFNAFKFPACASCNHKFSILEISTKNIIENMLSGIPLTANNFHILLNWFDKVRVGLWLGFQYLDSNLFGITPKFYIENRIGSSDRMIVIFKADNAKDGLTFIGCDFPSFYFTPSCFALRINCLFFLNISNRHLFSRRLGLPYITESFSLPGGGEEINIAEGRERIMHPLIKKGFSIHGKEIYQPMFRFDMNNKEWYELYDTPYVHSKSMAWERGVGKIFIQNDQLFHEYPYTSSVDYLPTNSYDVNELDLKITLETLYKQIYIDTCSPSLDLLRKDEKQGQLKEDARKRHFNKVYLDLIKDKMKQLIP